MAKGQQRENPKTDQAGNIVDVSHPVPPGVATPIFIQKYRLSEEYSAT